MTAPTGLDEIELNGKNYPILGSVRGSFIDTFSQQITIGDASYDNRTDLSSWVIKSPLYIGVEEMDERRDAFRCWWTNCIVRYDNHILPPRLATALTLPTPYTASDWNYGDRTEIDGSWGDADNVLASAGSATHQDRNGWGDYIYVYFPAMSCSSVRFTWGESASNVVTGYDLDYYDLDTLAWVNLVTVTGGNPSPGTVTTAIGSTKTISAIRLRFQDQTTGASYTCSGIEMYAESANVAGSFVSFENFNGSLYVAWANTIMKLNAGRTAYTVVADTSFLQNITTIIASLNSRLYIYLGDSTNYYWMDTSDVLTQSNSADAYWGVQFDAKLFKMNTDGAVAYSTDPDGGAPTWTSGGAITDIADQIEGFVIGRDASGNYTLYVRTNSILKAYDASTPQWVDTEAVLPNHPIGGEGAEYWNGKIYLSYGLGVKEYYTERGSFDDVGLTVRDGLPIEYNGEITVLRSGGSSGMFAGVDSSVTSGDSKSTLILFNAIGWQCWWADTSNNGAMNDIIVSSASDGYAVYWDCGGTVYYIDIPRGIENPDKISQTYATAGIFLSPWFDSGNQAIAKLAKALDDFAKGVTATETVTLKYRIDHTNTDLDTGWTTMDILETTGESGYNQELFASGAGISYKSIQFRLDFVTAGSTAKADIQNLVFYYRKRTGSEKKRVWEVNVLCDESKGTSSKEKIDNLVSAITSATDVAFAYHSTAQNTAVSYNVTVDGSFEEMMTGLQHDGIYRLRMQES